MSSMAARIDPLEKITPASECWRVKVRIIRLWYFPSFNDKDAINSIEFVFMDEAGSTMHATVRKTLVYKFKTQLKEGNVYIISYFSVCGNGGFFRTSKHEFRLNFQLRTIVRPSASDKIPMFGCNLIPFHEVLQCPADYPYLIDVMGLLTAVGTQREYVKDGKRTKMIVIELDADSVRLEVTLFGDYVDQVNAFLANGEKHQVIVIVQFAKIKKFRGKTVLQNFMFGTRLLFNPEMEEVAEFRNRLPVSYSEGSQGLNIISDGNNYSLEEDFLNSTVRKTIEELKDCKDSGFFIVNAYVKGIANGQDWWYTACKCNKAVHPDSGMYYCERCFCHVVNVTPRYRIKLRVMDVSDSTTFVIWDRDGCTLLQKSCSELLDSIKNRENSDGLPIEFENLLFNKELLFKVEVKSAVSPNFEPSFRVVRVCTDEEIITKFIKSAGQVEHNEPDMTTGVSLGDSSFNLGMQDTLASASKPDMSTGVSIGDSAFSLGMQDVLSSASKECSEMEILLSSEADNLEPILTPIKRSFEDGVLGDGDFSSTKLKEIKKEPED